MRFIPSWRRSKIKKTNAARILDKHKVEYDILEYKVDKNDLSALHVAQDTGQDIKTIFKTLVSIDENNQPIVACIAGDEELNLKALAKVAGVKKCTMLPLKEVLKVTGYMRGGCSPFGMKKIYRTFIDSDALLHVKIQVSAGIRGQQLKLDPRDFAKALHVEFAKVAYE